MATIAQIKALFESYISKDDERFITYGLQIAAHEAKLGHGKIAEELRRLIDIARKKGLCRIWQYCSARSATG